MVGKTCSNIFLFADWLDWVGPGLWRLTVSILTAHGFLPGYGVFMLTMLGFLPDYYGVRRFFNGFNTSLV